MKDASPTFAQIKAQVAAIRKKLPGTKSIAIRSKSKWSGNSSYEDNGEVFQIHQCDSPLAMRLALRESGNERTTVLITDLDDHDISDDILVRLKPRKLIPLDSWQIVKALFQVRAVDPRVTRHGWMADVLMDLIPPNGYPPVATGFLDAETVWGIVLDHYLGLSGYSLDLLAVLKWSIDTKNVERFCSAPQMIQEATSEWLVSTAGPTVAAVLDCAARSSKSNGLAEALPLGLAAGVVFSKSAKGKLERAIGKLESKYFDGHAPEYSIIERWSAAATEVVRLQLNDVRVKQTLLQRADEILREVGAEPFAYLSDTSPIGFDLRLADFGKQLSLSIAGSKFDFETLIEARNSISQHDRHSRERRRLERVDMAMRLVRWLGESQSRDDVKSLADAACRHLSEGGYIDWARLTLRSGDPVRELSEAYAQLFEKVTTAREVDSLRFAELLRDWTAAKSTDETIVPVEQVLERMVAPIAAAKPVLVVVIDGMSVAVFRELMADVLGHDWVLLAEEGVGLRPALATVPSVTEVSRTSLMTGKLAQGHAPNEKVGFAEHPALLKTCRSGFPPVLFHKASLQETDDSSLAADIRKEIGSAHRKIVGVVVNAVDDHLLKGEQIDTRWSRDEIKVLPVLLHEAKMAGRTVILLSDHGHILDCNAKGKQYEGGERWRFDETNVSEGELKITGERVVIPETHKLIAPWTEKIRYGIKKNGYHGGVSPQEMVIPIAVLNSSNAFPVGWSEAPVDTPLWWDIATSPAASEPETVINLKPAEPKPVPSGMLFNVDELVQQAENAASAVAIPESAATPPKAQAEWISRLLLSHVYEEQKRLGGRSVPADAVITRLLQAIDERGGKITSAALARAIQMPPLRLRGLLAIAQRVFNVDGYEVLSRDDVSDTIQLDRALLLKQFDLVE
ncbi:MAG: BREX-2 system phosphatase PglZ [Pirellula sp.]|nr:BREX-2 system phosphatase PglZ [Pirellula sp.]